MDNFVPGTQIPKPKVKLVGEEGNAYVILARARAALKAALVDKLVIDGFLKKAMAGDYDHLLQTVMEYVDEDDYEDEEDEDYNE